MRLRVRGPSHIELTVDAVVDSGFSASLTLPAAEIATLGLEYRSRSGAVLADGSLRRFGIYAAEVEWHGFWCPVLISEVGEETRLGMRLLAGNVLRIEVAPGGAVEIIPL
ncbi:MAG TPA: hypothetical protein VNH11_31780 [Pirellulales bacterium]|nr:hypothetical protein [Pirellulales bacterium]